MKADNYYSRRNRVSLVHNGQHFMDTCWELVCEAQQKILFHTYAFQLDRITERFVDALLERAQSGVKVFIIIDAIGSPEISAQLKKRFVSAGVRFCYFAPIVSKRLENVGRRLHQKVLVVDNHKALVGGINHTEHFIEPPEGHPWLDYAALLEGEEVVRLQWQVKQLYDKYFPEEREWLGSMISPQRFSDEFNDLVRTNVNDFMRFKSDIYRSYIQAIRRSEHSITIFATYFLPGKGLLRELKRAAKRGVCVELIFSAESDHPPERWSSKYLYSWYLKHGIKVYEWDKSIVHGKVAIIDGSWVTLGSYNHNFLSRYVSLELNLEVMSRSFSREVAAEVEATKQLCREIDADLWRKSTDGGKRFLYLFSYALANFASLLSTLVLVRKKKIKNK